MRMRPHPGFEGPGLAFICITAAHTALARNESHGHTDVQGMLGDVV